jgi:sirohydrochlorin ferrochelatase
MTLIIIFCDHFTGIGFMPRLFAVPSVLVVLAVLPGRAIAQTASSPEPATTGTILVAHGASADWNAPVHRIADAAHTGGPVEVSFLMGDSAASYRFQDAAARLVARGATRIVVVPLLASSYSGHYEQIRYLARDTAELDPSLRHHLDEAGIERAAGTVPLRLTPAIDASMEAADILAERALHLARTPAEQSLFIIGHGPGSAEDYARWMDHLRPVADSVRSVTGFRDVKLGLVRDDAAPSVRREAVRRIRELIELQAEATGRDVVVVPLLIAKGYISTQKLPEDLEGLPIVYDGEGLLPHPALAAWIERRVQEGASSFTTDVAR